MNTKLKKSITENAEEQAKSEFEQNSVATITPMMQQYLDVKEKYKDYLLFYRMGDFFELFYDDAITASRALDIVLTRRGKAQGVDIPMCGVPAHSSESYLHKLIKQGFKVALCDQVETPEEAKQKRGYKAVVKREVTRVVTPGTLTEDNLLDASAYNFLLAINAEKQGFIAISWCDISTGELYFSNIKKADLLSEIERISPKEIILNDEILSDRALSEIFSNHKKLLSPHSKSFFDAQKAERKIKELYGISSIESFSIKEKQALGAIGALIEYLEITQVGNLPKLSPPKNSEANSFMEIDIASFNNLEIFKSPEGGTSLYQLINNTQTNAGARYLQKILARPLIDKNEINNRLDTSEFFINNPETLSDLKNILKTVPDFERILSRIHLNRSNPRDMAVLRDGLKAVLKLQQLFSFSNHIKLPSQLKGNLNDIENFDALINLLDNSITEFPPINLNEGGYIKNGFNAKLDDYRNIKQKADKIKNELQEKYIRETGVNTLKIKDNNVIGMFIEVTAIHMEKMPDHFIHRQTLANNVRYTTPDLKKIENEIINAANYSINLEQEIYQNLRNEIINFSEKLIKTSVSISYIDVFSGFAFLAENYGYTRPEISDGIEFIAEDARHPIIENAIKKSSEKQNFISNILSLTLSKNLWLLTGPNMSGKSTFLRQNALIAIMAQIGCFVPAKKVRLGIVDKIFSRVGASDNLAKGHSTFMVEMIETANILNNATEKSFVILDEIGRGTATFDGLAVAWATLEHIHDNIRCRCLFATHYHELNSLENELKNLECHTTQVKEWNDEIIFMHKIIAGKANQSYGVHVAKIAGLPKNVITRANEILSILAEKNKTNQTDILTNNLPLFSERNSDKFIAPEKSRVKNSGIFEHEKQLNQNEIQILNQLKQLDINNLTPIQTFNLLVDISKKLQS